MTETGTKTYRGVIEGLMADIDALVLPPGEDDSITWANNVLLSALRDIKQYWGHAGFSPDEGKRPEPTLEGVLADVKRYFNPADDAERHLQRALVKAQEGIFKAEDAREALRPKKRFRNVYDETH